MNAGEIGDGSNINSVSVKLPPFWEPCPQAWFIQAETQFNSKGITQDQTKYEYIIQALPVEIIAKVLDILQSPPQIEKYSNLKNTLIQRFSDTEEKKLELLLSNSEMGDNKPSEFYRRMKILARTTSSIGEDLIKRLWLRKLPTNINIAIATAGERDINDLLLLADKIYDISKFEQISSSHVNNPTSEINLLNLFSHLENKINNLEQHIRDLSFQHNNYYPNSNNSSFQQHNHSRNYNNRSRSRSSSRPKYPINCWYHTKFGNKASKCVPPCHFRDGSNSKNEITPQLARLI